MEVELAELGLLFHMGQYDCKIVESEKPVVVIEAPHTVEEGKVLDPHWMFPAFWDVLNAGTRSTLPPVMAIRHSSMGILHLGGLVNLALKAVVDADVLPHFRYPEAFLHPSIQVALADFFIALRNPWQTLIKFILNNGQLLKPIPMPEKEKPDAGD